MDHSSKVKPLTQERCRELQIIFLLKRLSKAMEGFTKEHIENAFAKVTPRDSAFVTEEKWLRALSSLHIPHNVLLEKEIQLLTEHFKVNEGLIDYKSFIEEIHQVSFKKLPKLQVTLPEASLLQLKFDVDEDTFFDDEEERRIFHDIMMKILTLTYKRGYDLRQYAKDMLQGNRYGFGKVNVDTFSKMIYRLGITLKPIEFAVVVKRFIEHNYLINFKLFTEYIEELAQLSKAPCGYRPKPGLIPPCKDKAKRIEMNDNAGIKKLLGRNYSGHPVTFTCREENLRNIIHRIQRYIYEYRINDFKPLFQEKDPHNFGLISPEIFRAVLSLIGVSSGTLGTLYLTKHEIDKILSFYASPDNPNLIQWRHFYDDVNTIWGTPEESPNEINPLTGRSDVIPLQHTITPRGASYEELSLEDRQAFEKLLQNCTFYDRMNEHISAPFMFGNLKRLDKLPMQYFLSAENNVGRKYNDKEFGLIESIYWNTDRFNYHQFIEDLRKVKAAASPKNKKQWMLDREAKEREKAKEFKEFKEKSVTELDDSELPNLEYVMNKIRSLIQIRNAEIWQFLKIHDKPTKYQISRAGFKAALSAVGAILDDHEIETVFRNFIIPNGTAMNYKKFYDTLERLDKGVLGPPSTLFPPEFADISSFDTAMTMEELRQLDGALDILCRKLCLTYEPRGFLSYRKFIEEIRDSLRENELSSKQLTVLFKAFAKKIGTDYLLQFSEFRKHIETLRMARNKIRAIDAPLYTDPHYLKQELFNQGVTFRTASKDATTSFKNKKESRLSKDNVFAGLEKLESVPPQVECRFPSDNRFDAPELMFEDIGD